MPPGRLEGRVAAAASGLGKRGPARPSGSHAPAKRCRHCMKMIESVHLIGMIKVSLFYSPCQTSNGLRLKQSGRKNRKTQEKEAVANCNQRLKFSSLLWGVRSESGIRCEDLINNTFESRAPHIASHGCLDSRCRAVGYACRYLHRRQRTPVRVRVRRRGTARWC